jgi:hypothetical protein
MAGLWVAGPEPRSLIKCNGVLNTNFTQMALFVLKVDVLWKTTSLETLITISK